VAQSDWLPIMIATGVGEEDTRFDLQRESRGIDEAGQNCKQKRPF